MKKRILCIVLSSVMVAAFLLSSCGPTGKEVKQVEQEEGVPQYGGTLTVLPVISQYEPSNPDQMQNASNNPCRYLKPIQENPILGDLEKYGPRGSGEFMFDMACVPYEYCTGNLIESWELSPKQTIWHVRPGIYWAPNEEQKKWMPVRELVAQDIVEDLLRFRESSSGPNLRKVISDIYAKDKYTVVMETNYFDVNLLYQIGFEDRANVSPPEMVEAGPSLYENQVGTGPFMFEEYVVGSHMSYVKNPNYWKKTTINGVEYQMPFVDKLVQPIIADMSTRVAALRTGKVDVLDTPPASQWKTIEETCPGILSTINYGFGTQVALRCDKPPFDNRDVRRAMMIALDLKAFGDYHGIGPQPIHWYPMYPPYTPYEDLPAETQLLYSHDPNLARKMLAEAGYPDGFTMQYYTQTDDEWQDRASMLKDMWEEIGVTLEIHTDDMTTWRGYMDSRTYVDSIHTSIVSAWPLDMLRYAPGMDFDFALWKNEKFEKLAATAQQETDDDARHELIKEAAVIFLNEVPYLPLDNRPQKLYYWPWLKNYYGEWNIEDATFLPIVPYIWIDQKMKEDMGFK